MMPQLGQKLISRFLTDFTSPANGRHMLNPQLQISQLRGVRDKVTHTFAHVHAPASNITCSIRHASPFHSHMEIKKSHLQIIRNRSYHLPLCGSSVLYTDQQVPASGIAQTRGGCWLCKACGSHKCGKC